MMQELCFKNNLVRESKCLKQNVMMDKNLHDIDELFLSSLESYEEGPSEDVWASIENDLNRTDAKKYKAKHKFLLKEAVCVSLILVSLCVSDIIQTYNHDLKRKDTGI